MNQINIIYPYTTSYGQLVFDDENTGLKAEAFVNGANIALQVAAKIIGVDPSKFKLTFSKDKFPGFQFSAKWIRKGFEGEEMSGDWYLIDLGEGQTAEGWLCAALLKYFDTAPKMIYFQIKAV